MSVEDSSWAINRDVGSSSCGKFVFIAMCAYADADGVTRATLVNIAALTRLTLRSVTKHVGYLIKQGLVVKESPAVYRVVGIPGGGSTFLEKKRIDVQKSPSRWGKVRLAVLERDAHVCAYCQTEANTVDHVVPRSRGGSDEMSNLVAACRRCNSSKCAKPVDEWRANDA